MKKRKAVAWLVFAALMAVIILQLPGIIGGGFYIIGSRFYAAGNYHAAAGAYRSAVLLNPRWARAYVDLGSSYLALRNYKAAEQTFLKASSIQAESCASCGLGMTYHQLGREDDAEKAFHRAMSLNHEDVCAYAQSGRMYYDLEQYQKAIGVFKWAVTLRANFADYMYLGNSYVWAREYEPGIEAYKQAIRLNPDDVRAHVQLGIAYDYLRRYTEAVEEYRQALKLDRNDERAHYALARAYLAMRNRSAAFAEYEILRKINPGKAAELFSDPALTHNRESGNEKLYFIPVGRFSSGSLKKLVSYYQRKPGVNAITTQPIPLELPAIDKQRQQLIAEEVIELIKRRYPKLAADPNAILIGLTDEDMYIRDKTWRFAFCYRADGRFAVVSSARMNPVKLGEAADNGLLDSRMRKMVLKNIGLLYYLLPANSDWKSVLYRDVESVKDLDRMGEDF